MCTVYCLGTYTRIPLPNATAVWFIVCGKTLYRFTHTDVPPVSPTGTETRYLARGRGGQPPSSSSWLALSSMRCCRGWSWYVLLASPSTSVIRLVQRCTPIQFIQSFSYTALRPCSLVPAADHVASISNPISSNLPHCLHNSPFHLFATRFSRRHSTDSFDDSPRSRSIHCPSCPLLPFMFCSVSFVFSTTRQRGRLYP